jgi:hypothetical protein
MSGHEPHGCAGYGTGMALAGTAFEVETRKGKRVVPYRFRMANGS